MTTNVESALAELFRYPLMSALFDRRTRRISQGTSILAGDLSYESHNDPAPLSALEEAVLIASTGLTGVTMHDGPLTKPDGTQELGTPFINVLGRSASSADNCQATSFFMINDEGIWLIRNLRGREALETMGELSPNRSEWSEGDWIASAEAVKYRVYDQRLEFPREFPYYIGWNKQTSNRPGTTIFFPVVDCTRQYINALLILLSEPDGQRPLFIDDWRKFHPRSVVDWVAWSGSLLGMSQKIPYHPIGGVKHVRSGFLSADITVPLGAAHTLRTDYGAFFLMQNLMLVGQALGLGGWVHGAPLMPFVFERDPAKQWLGLGFRMQPLNKKLGSWPPIPASQPNPVGIDGVLEGLCPPYVRSMDDAVDMVIEDKFGERGTYGDADIFSRPYNSNQHGEAYLRDAKNHTPEAIAYTKEICNYIYDTYGRFPAHVDSFYTPDVWVQFSHLEIEYYERFYDPKLFSRQAQHSALWGEH